MSKREESLRELLGDFIELYKLSGNVVGSLIMQSRFESHLLWYATCGIIKLVKMFRPGI